MGARPLARAAAMNSRLAVSGTLFTLRRSGRPELRGAVGIGPANEPRFLDVAYTQRTRLKRQYSSASMITISPIANA